MGGPTYWGVAGFLHSLTPKLFQIMAKITGVEEAEQAFLQASDMDQFINEVSKMDGLWLSYLSSETPGDVSPRRVRQKEFRVNQLGRSGGSGIGQIPIALGS